MRYEKRLASYSAWMAKEMAIEDVKQECAIAFLSAVKSYDESYGVPFRPFAMTVIKRKIISYKQRQRKIWPTRQLAALEDAGDYTSNGYAEADERQFIEWIWGLISKSLTGREREALTMHASGMRAKEIAAAMQTSEKAVYRAIDRGRGKVRSMKKHLITST
jgi:RNA polymerase sigma factor (sigma-70 family)